jgi:hypothetical protein
MQSFITDLTAGTAEMTVRGGLLGGRIELAVSLCTESYILWRKDKYASELFLVFVFLLK